MMNTTLAIECPFCGHITEITVDVKDYIRWMKGELAQNAFPYLSDTKRETIISGICSSCWEDFFPEEEEGEDDTYEEMGFDPYAGCYTWDC